MAFANFNGQNICIFILAAVICSGVKAIGPEHSFCTDLKPQNTLDIGQIMGMWYGVEVIQHQREEEAITVYETCPVIHLSEISYEMTTTESHIRPGSYGYKWTGDRYGVHDREYHHLRLYWDDSGNNNEYYLKYNSTRKGFWYSSGPQNDKAHVLAGSILQRQYNQFAGTVQVMKAVGDHMVLTICQRLPESQLFSVILSREPQQLSRQVLHSIHNLLNRRDLSTSVVRKVCRNSSESNRISAAMVIFSIVSAISYMGFNLV